MLDLIEKWNGIFYNQSAQKNWNVYQLKLIYQFILQ